MSNVQEALKAAIEALDGLATGKGLINPIEYTIEQCKAALAEIEKCEPVAEAIRERDRLGFAVVNVIGKLDEIIENTQEVEVDDFLHIAVPVDMWNELQAALEDMPKRADLYTSPQPIEKCEPVAYLKFISRQWLVNPEIGMDGFQGFDVCDKDEKGDDGSDAFAVYTSPQPRDWVGLTYKQKVALREENDWYNFPSDLIEATEAKLKQLNTKG